MNIAVLGASFDPAHNGHLAIAKNVLKSGRISKVILMPVNIHPFAKILTSAKYRLGMAKLLEEKNIKVSDLELKKNSTSYSIDTLQALKQKFPKDEFYWVIGSDHLDKFTKWKDWKKIISDFGLIVVPRDIKPPRRSPFGHLRGETLRNIITLDAKEFTPIDISSSEIKKKVKKGKKIDDLVPKTIENYIIQNRLYI